MNFRQILKNKNKNNMALGTKEMLLLKKKLKTWEEEWQWEERFSTHCSLSSGLNGNEVVQVEARSSELHPGLPCSNRSPVFGRFSVVFLGALAVTGSEHSSQYLNQHLNMRCFITSKQCLNGLHHNTCIRSAVKYVLRACIMVYCVNMPASTQHSIPILVWVSAALFPIQVPAYAPGKTEEDPSVWAPASTWDIWKSLTVGFSLAQFKLFGYLRSEPTDKKTSLCFSLSLILSPSFWFSAI